MSRRPVKVTGPRLAIRISPIDALRIYAWGVVTGALATCCFIYWG